MDNRKVGESLEGYGTAGNRPRDIGYMAEILFRSLLHTDYGASNDVTQQITSSYGPDLLLLVNAKPIAVEVKVSDYPGMLAPSQFGAIVAQVSHWRSVGAFPEARWVLITNQHVNERMLEELGSSGVSVFGFDLAESVEAIRQRLKLLMDALATP